MPLVDAHQHYWNPARGDYSWMPPDHPILTRVYGPGDLQHSREAVGIDHTVLVQAAESIEETEYMLGIADATPSVAGVVGWIDFENKDHRAQLERLARHPKFKGVRPMIQDIPNVDWMLRDDVQWAYDAVTDLDLAFDALGFPHHLDNFLTVFSRYPKMRVVVDHCMKPQIGAHTEARFAHWAERMTRIAVETGAFCKLSGIITEASEDWSVDTLRPYTDHVLQAFGLNRVMWGSDWPVCRLRGEYDAWHTAAQALTAHLSVADKAKVFGETAVAFYRLDI
ncbi:amidohydrolase family protein [Ruegeria arenilitoris]|uniref:amidohydrolase family protein n=1 Tax=Ruegeria arenilitoris TaxID=1173585 RepID=UPI001480BB6A|nr:amidohydrolase family protein [Ruegeria arenilitoris]